MTFHGLNASAILASTMSAFLVGGFWYSPLVGATGKRVNVSNATTRPHRKEVAKKYGHVQGRDQTLLRPPDAHAPGPALRAEPSRPGDTSGPTESKAAP
jgi:hypothetical protein